MKIDHRLVTARQNLLTEYNRNPESSNLIKWKIIYNVLGYRICRQFLLSLTGNEPFYSDLFRQYNEQSVHLNIDKISRDFPDILGDYTEYRNYL